MSRQFDGAVEVIFCDFGLSPALFWNRLVNFPESLSPDNECGNLGIDRWHVILRSASNAVVVAYAS
jgi:hypothetical protein